MTMPREGQDALPGPNGMQDFDELQRGEEKPITVETMERTSPYRYGDNGPRQYHIPDPGERPGAIHTEELTPAVSAVDPAEVHSSSD